MPILSQTVSASLPALRLPAVLRRVLVPVALLAIWQAAASLGFTSPQTMPAPSLILASLWNLIVTGQLGPNLLVSLLRVSAGLAAGVTAGTVLGLAAGLTRIGEDFIDPTVQMARTLPHLALLPLMILWFGIGETPKIVIIALGASFPIYLNLFAAIRGADRKLLEAAGMLGLSAREVIWHVVLPSAASGLPGRIAPGPRHRLDQPGRRRADQRHVRHRLPCHERAGISANRRDLRRPAGLRRTRPRHRPAGPQPGTPVARLASGSARKLRRFP